MNFYMNIIKKADGQVKLEPFYSEEDDSEAMLNIQKQFLEDDEQIIGSVDVTEFNRALAVTSDINGKLISEEAGFNPDGNNFLVQVSQTFTKNIWVNASDEDEAIEHVNSSTVIFSDIDYLSGSSEIDIIDED